MAQATRATKAGAVDGCAEQAPVRAARVQAEIDAARANRRVDYDKLLAHAEAAFDLACQPDGCGEQDTAGMAAALNLLAHRSCVLSDTATALAQGTQALSLIDTEAPSQILGEIYNSMGWAYFCTGDYPEALELLLRGLRIAEEIGDRSLQAYTLDSIATVHASSEHPQEAVELQEKALGLHRELGDAVGEATCLTSLAYTCRDLGDWDTALLCAHTALSYCEREGRELLLVGVLESLADLHLQLGEIADAEAYASRGLEIALEHGWRADEANAMRLLGQIAFERGDLAQASASVTHGLELAEDFGWVVEQYTCHLLLSSIEESRCDYSAALAHYKSYHELLEAKVNGETRSRLASMRVELQVASAKKDGEIQRLRALALEREVEERRIAQARLEAQASLDPLTGLFNRGHMPVISAQLAKVLKLGQCVSLIIFDIDHFKVVNDTHGHLAGDRVLLSIAQQLRENVRDGDTPCRYGGDEFLVLLPGLESGAARATAERILEAVRQAYVVHGMQKIAATVSVGVATLHAGEKPDLERLIESADRALYSAKQAGRDRVVVTA